MRAEPSALYHEIHDRRMPIVLIHGFPLDHAIWTAQAQQLSRSHRVICPDLRGHGRSPAGKGSYDMDAMAGDIITLLDELSVERAVWVGHSMGGYVVMAALRVAPDRVGGIALVSTHPHPDSEEKQAGRHATADKVMTEGSVVIAEAMRPLLFAPGFDLDSDVAREVFETMKATPAAGVAGALRAMASRPDSSELLRRTQLPALVIAGTEDQIISLALMEAMAAEIPRAALVVIERAGHLPMLEHPEAVSEVLSDFADSLSD